MKEGFYQVPMERNHKEIRDLLKKLSEENKKLINEIKSLEIKDKNLSHLSNEVEKELSKKCRELEKNQGIIAELQDQLLKIDQLENEYWRSNLLHFPVNLANQAETAKVSYDAMPTYSQAAFFPYRRFPLERISNTTNEKSLADDLTTAKKDSKDSRDIKDVKEKLHHKVNKEVFKDDGRLVIGFIKQCNDLLKGALVHFGHSKESQQKVNILQQAIAILSSSDTPHNKLQNFYAEIEENRNLFKKRFNLGSQIKRSMILSTCINPVESRQSTQEFFETYKKLLPEDSDKEQALLDAIDEEKADKRWSVNETRFY